MDHTGNDQIIAFAPDITLESRFVLKGDAILENSGKVLTTKLCGLGWYYFTVSIVPTQSMITNQNTGMWGITAGKRVKLFEKINKMHVDIHFDPYFAASMRYIVKRVECSMNVPDNYGPPTLHGRVHQTSIPLGLKPHRIGSFLDTGSAPFYKICFTVQIGENLGGSLQTNIGRHVADTLADTIQTGRFIDTKMYAYSRRKGRSGARDPQVLWASSDVIHGFGIEDLSTLFSHHGFQGSEDVNIDLHTLDDDQQSVDVYDYDSDSDLEDDNVPPEPGLSRTATPATPDTSPLDVPLPDSDDHLFESSEPKDVEDSESENPLALDDESLHHKSSASSTNTVPHGRSMGRVLVLRDGAYRTWKALIHYIYFPGDVQFSRLSSLVGHDPDQSKNHFECSPKSMYRLADKYGVDILKQSALRNIEGQLSPANIVAESTSTFTSLYPEVMECEIEFLRRHRSDEVVQMELRRVARERDRRTLEATMIALLQG